MADGNGNKKLWYAVGVILLAALISFTTHKVYVSDPSNYATKTEVSELKSDIKDELKEIKRDIKTLIRRGE